MTDLKDTAFFDAQSATYSEKRYPAVARTFTQHFFNLRLARTLDLLAPVFAPLDAVRVLEVGCADGYVAAKIEERFGGRIESFDAVDIAPAMIEQAERLFPEAGIAFSVRGATLGGPYDVIVETGVLNYLDLEAEVEQVADALAADGVYVCSIAGSSSLQNMLKGGAGYRHLRSYGAYERAFAARFRRVRTVPVGFFVPLLWRVPAFARAVQPALEALGRAFPALAHEHLYVFRKS